MISKVSAIPGKLQLPQKTLLKVGCSFWNEFWFSFFFILIFGFITGFSSIIFGVLVRLRAPLLPFLALLLVIDVAEDKKETVDIEDDSKIESNGMPVLSSPTANK